MEMQDAVGQALAQCYDRFVHKPQWLVLATAVGEHLGHFIQPGTSIEPDRVTALAAAAAGHHERRAMEFQLGSVQYGLSFGTTGFEVVVFLVREWVLSLKFAESDRAILIDTLQILPEAVDPLIQLSKKNG
jgi:hypothetical protein